MEARIRTATSMTATAGDVERIAAHFEPQAVHYFPPGMYEGPFRGARTIGAKWRAAVRESWVVLDRRPGGLRSAAASRGDRVDALQAQASGVMLRGDEWYVFSERGLIEEIRAYYASPQDAIAARARARRFRLRGPRLSDEGAVDCRKRGGFCSTAPWWRSFARAMSWSRTDGRGSQCAEAVHLPPVEPSKILCAHLNYRNRLEELKAACPPAPNYFASRPRVCSGTAARSFARRAAGSSTMRARSRS